VEVVLSFWRQKILELKRRVLSHQKSHEQDEAGYHYAKHRKAYLHAL